MGASQSQQTYNKISATLPQVQEHGWDNNKWGSSSVKAFRNEDDRTQFIHSLMTLISNNGSLWLQNHDYKLLFSRKQQLSPSSPSSSQRPPTAEEDQFIATLVAVNTITLIIDAKIESSEAGKSQAEAFKAFKKYVELRLHETLSSVPDAAHLKVRGARANAAAVGDAGPSSSLPTSDAADLSSRRTSITTVMTEQPPAYESAGDVYVPGAGFKKF